ncbi:sensor histidine kinase regulating citrate/malate metabolism [Anaerosolibacter carboniphilus]|uniref:histidine kinase n=1 Tax=Anaerosolibacter carboniphilus TaxID=1417629 RepID=A0A841KY88_9FIRM|nr:ATP-binding protein [Anaerosolibacter carboniphilus]MBB6218431.1 sensor histidine kinase regulating citrate/malate metabolism [Anaerosolibacter carboniphilus]
MKLYTKAYFLIIVILVQSLTVILLTNQLFINMIKGLLAFDKYSYPVAIILNLLAISAFFSIYFVLRFLHIERESIIKLNHSQEVIDALHGQKHDFNNHLNLIAGMLQVGKPERALEYIFDVSQKVDEVFSISKIKNIEIAATLSRKCAIAESKGITVEMDITTSLENLRMDPIELCKVLFNLLDNAIYELEHSDHEQKILSIDISDHDHRYCIAIGNSYPILPSELYDRVFQPRYTTKNGEGHGYGLSIVKQIVDKNKGSIAVESYEGIGTIFTVFLPQI